MRTRKTAEQAPPAQEAPRRTGNRHNRFRGDGAAKRVAGDTKYYPKFGVHQVGHVSQNKEYIVRFVSPFVFEEEDFNNTPGVAPAAGVVEVAAMTVVTSQWKSTKAVLSKVPWIHPEGHVSDIHDYADIPLGMLSYWRPSNGYKRRLVVVLAERDAPTDENKGRSVWVPVRRLGWVGVSDPSFDALLDVKNSDTYCGVEIPVSVEDPLSGVVAIPGGDVVLYAGVNPTNKSVKVAFCKPAIRVRGKSLPNIWHTDDDVEETPVYHVPSDMADFSEIPLPPMDGETDPPNLFDFLDAEHASGRYQKVVEEMQTFGATHEGLLSAFFGRGNRLRPEVAADSQEVLNLLVARYSRMKDSEIPREVYAILKKGAASAQENLTEEDYEDDEEDDAGDDHDAGDLDTSDMSFDDED